MLSASDVTYRGIDSEKFTIDIGGNDMFVHQLALHDFIRFKTREGNPRLEPLAEVVSSTELDRTLA